MDLEGKIAIAHPHTLNKFDLIEAYVEGWSQKLLNSDACENIIFIDCMCNNGIYKDEAGNTVYGTPIRVSNYLSKIMVEYPKKRARCIYSDLDADKIEMLRRHIPSNTANFNIETHVTDGNALLKSFDFSTSSNANILLVYDPFDAKIDWEALRPFLCTWGEVILNHVVSDPVRAISQVKRPDARTKYEGTYLSSLEELVTFGSDRETYERRIKDIMHDLRNVTTRKYFIASFPFYNSKNVVVYNLLLGTSNVEGFKLFKKVAWNTFEDRSSAKNTRGYEKQRMFDLNAGTMRLANPTDENCYNVIDIAEYLHLEFKGQIDVPLGEVWDLLGDHPVFPSEGYRNDIKGLLKDEYGYKVSRSSISFV